MDHHEFIRGLTIFYLFFSLSFPIYVFWSSGEVGLPFYTPDVLLFMLFSFAYLFMPSFISNVKELICFVALILSYEVMRGYANRLSPSAVNFELPIGIDKFILGKTAPEILQQIISYNPLTTIFFLFFYSLHFIYPVAAVIYLMS
ncbi:MAG: hypothetical protein QW171_00870 [Candidatus Bilamarchaeaceae archaeon]